MNANGDPVARLLALLNGVKPAGPDQWRSCCPSHNDRVASLSVGRGDDGRALVNCKAGCETAAVLGAVGLTVADLFTGRNANGRPQAATPTRPGSTARPAKSKTVYATPEAAIEAANRQAGGTLAGQWSYAGDAFRVLRFDLPGVEADGRPKKTFRPVHRLADGTGQPGWALGDPPGPLPLYRGDEVPDTGPVVVVEGEKCADAARSIGLAAVTSAHGAKSAAKSDWRTLAGREVIILPDNDQAGRKYAEDVAAIQTALNPPATVRVVNLPDLPEHGDISDWLGPDGPMNAKDADQCRDAILGMAEAAPEWTPASPTKGRIVTPPEPYRPFPVDALPEPIREFVNAASRAIGCDPAFVALPLLSALASAIGNTRRIELKRGWAEPGILWTASIGESGTLKSPGQDVALRPIRQRQVDAMKRHDEAMEIHSQAIVAYDRDLLNWRKSKGAGDPPTKPREPMAARFIVSDTTIESLALLLQDAPRGLLLACDELAGWLNAFDAYKQGKGDAAHWIELHGGRPLLVDRKSANPKTIHVPRAAVSITGGIQPDTLRRALGSEHFSDGLAARLLLAMPDRKPRVWTESEIAPDLERKVAAIVARFHELQFNSDAQGDSAPVNVPLSADGKAAWITFYNEHGREQSELAGDLAAAWSKLEGYAARLALIVHFVRWAAGDPTLADPNAIDAESVGAGVALSRWFGAEAKRVYGVLAEDEQQREQRELLDLVRRKGGQVTVRELMQASRRYRDSSESAELALAALVKAGLAVRETIGPGEKGGRPADVFRLDAAVYGNTTPRNP